MNDQYHTLPDLVLNEVFIIISEIVAGMAWATFLTVKKLYGEVLVIL
jgi:hypothetical protein